MRVIAGSLGGRMFDSPHSTRTHPMSDKMRGAMFNILGDIDGLTVLDAFAGTGALSIEAISRGATSALAIESDRQVQQTIEQNIKTLELASRMTCAKMSNATWLSLNPRALFDLVLCDPPYDDLQPMILSHLAGHVHPDTGVLVLSLPAKELPFHLPGLAPVSQRSYGDAQLVFYRPSAERM